MKRHPELVALVASMTALVLVAWRTGTFDRRTIARTSVAVGPAASIDPATLAETVRYTEPFTIAVPRRIDARVVASPAAAVDVLVSLVEVGSEEVHEATTSLARGREETLVFDGVAPGTYRLRLVAVGNAADLSARSRARLIATASGGSRAALVLAAALLAAPLLASFLFRRGRAASSPRSRRM